MMNYTPKLLSNHPSHISVESFVQDSQLNDEIPNTVQEVLKLKERADHFYEIARLDQAIELYQVAFSLLLQSQLSEQFIDTQLEILQNICEAAH